MRYISLLFILLFVLIFKASAQNENVLFIIQEDTVDFEEFKYVYSKNNSLRNDAFKKSDIEEYLELYINFKLKVAEARSLGYDTTSKFIKEYNTYKDQLTRPFLTQESFKDSLIDQAYDRYKEIINASHILIKMEEDESDTIEYYNKAFSIYEKVLSNQGFEKLAAKYSEEPNASKTRGNLGYFTSMQMVYPFENVAYNTNVNSVSEPFRTDFGYHIIKVNDRRENPGKVKVSHIMLRYKNQMTPEDSVEIEGRINSIHVELSASPLLWDSICKKYSEDLRSKENGGKLNPFGVGEIIPVFAEVSFSIKETGDISEPFRSPYGWHIVRLDSIIQLPEKEVILPEIRSKVLRGERLLAGKESSAQYLKTKYKYSANSDIYHLMMEFLENKLFKVNLLAKSISNKTLFTLDSIGYKVVTFKDFITNKYSKSRLQDTTAIFDASKEYESFVLSELEKLEKLDLYLNNPEYRILLTEYEEGMLLFEIMEDNVWNAASTDSVGLNNYYSTHLGQYTAIDSAKLVIFEVDLKNLDSIASLAEESSFKKKLRKREALWVDLSQWKESRYEDFFTLYEEKPMIGLAIEYGKEKSVPLDDIKGKVISDYQQELESIWIERLKEKYQVLKNEEEIESAIVNLSNE